MPTFRQTLTGSENFLQTHAAIRLVSQYADFTRVEADELLRAAVRNTQIRWIIEDDDVSSFYTGLAHQYDDVVDPTTLSEFWALLERDCPTDVAQHRWHWTYHASIMSSPLAPPIRMCSAYVAA
jgi:hypothetical protein